VHNFVFICPTWWSYIPLFLCRRAFDDEDTIEEQAEVVTTILWPVIITMILSIIVVKILSQGGDFVSCVGSKSFIFVETDLC
jgi:hypothetical protein